MNKNFLFFIISTLIIIFTVALLNLGPAINGSLDDFKTLNCLKESDTYKRIKENNDKLLEEEGITDDTKNRIERENKSQKTVRDCCYRNKAMYGLEYSAFTIDIIAGVLCSLLGLIHYLEDDKSKPFLSKTGLIGLISGGISFIITLIYIIYSALVFTGSSSGLMKIDDNGVFAKWDSNENKYICSFYDEKNENGAYAKFNELGKKQYNYIKEQYLKMTDIYNSDPNRSSEIKACYQSNDEARLCASYKEYRGDLGFTTLKSFIDENGNSKNCENLYIKPVKDFENKDIYDRWLSSIILSILNLLCTVGLAFFGFTLFKNKDDSQSNEVKVA